MARPPQIAPLAALRAQRVDADAALAAAIADVEAARRRRDRLVSQAAGANAIGEARAALATAQERYASTRIQRGALLEQVAAQSAAAANAENDDESAALFSALEGDQPILMLPVRLETRYGSDALGRRELLVRVYPDSAHVQRHLSALTEAEQDAGRAYWAARFARLSLPAPEDNPPSEAWRMQDQRAVALWAELVRTLRAPRAAWVVQRTRPLNAADLDAANPAPAEPDFPPAEPPGSRLSAQPAAVMLPDRFCAVGLDDAGRVLFRRFGLPVPDVLAMSPVIAPGDKPGAAEAQAAFSGEAAWLADFDAAVAVGMGLRIRQADVDAWRQRHPGTPAFNLANVLPAMVVLGIDWTLTPEQAADGVAALLEAQAASAGIGFIPVGTPTNNTRSGVSGHSPARLRDPAAASPEPPAPGTSAAEALRFALGLPDSAFTTVALPGAELDDAALAGHMANALYAGTIGSYLQQMWVDADGPFKLSAATQDLLRAHVVTYLRPAGPLQPLRVDMQPYGLLPVLAPSRYVGENAFETGLQRVLQLLRPKWESALGQVPRFDGSTASTHALLQHGPWAQTVSYRLIEQDAVASAAQSQLAGFQQGLRGLPGSIYLQTMQATWGPAAASTTVLSSLPLARAVLQPEASRLPAAMPWVLADAEVKTREAADATPAPGYIAQLAAAIDAGTDLKGRFARLRQSQSLLQGLLTWSADREADTGNVSLLADIPGALAAGSAVKLLRTPLAVGVDDTQDDDRVLQLEHAGQVARLAVPGVTGDDGIGTHVARQAASAVAGAVRQGQPLAYGAWFKEPQRATLDGWQLRLPRYARHLASVRASLAELSTRTVGELDWALRTTLDGFDYRLDAWATSLATRRLARLRVGAENQRRTGLHVGAYGWVLDLRPDPAGHRESRGHMLMPSLRHAAAAAVLRSGFDNGDANERKAFALDLSSARVRAARDLFEGLAQGQPLARLLGYRFERALRDTALAQHILALRRAFPLRAAGQAANGNPLMPAEDVAVRDVVDGVAVLAASADAVANASGVAAGAPRNRLLQAHAELATLWDAVADVSVAESVYQVTQGNMERAAAALATLDKQSQPVEPQSVQSPREGISYTQRVLWLLDAQADAPAGWPQDAPAQAEPFANAWAAEMLGDPARFVVRASAQVEGVADVQAVEVHAAQLGASPLALLLAVNAPGTGSSDAQVGTPEPGTAGDSPQPLSRLRVLVVEALQADVAARFPGRAARLSIEEQRAGESGLLHLEALLALAQRLLAQSRPATRRDLAVVEPQFDLGNADGDFPGVLADELVGRAEAALATLQALQLPLAAAVAASDAAAARPALRALRHHGVLGAEAEARPDLAPADRDAADLQRADTALRDVDARLLRAQELLAAADTTVASRAAAATDAIKALLGKAFPVLPLFTPGPAAAGVAASLAAQDMLLANQSPATVAGWLPKIAKVRDGADRLQSLLLAREALVGALPSRRFAVLQSTARPGPRAPWEQPWMALPQAWPQADEAELLGTAHARPDLAVALLRPDGLQSVADDSQLVGLVCDDWAETVPLHTSTAAVAFHYDAPGARPPQTLLLAVPPRLGLESWDFDTVLDTVRESLALARLRAVRPPQLPDAVNLALPMNAIPDSNRKDMAGFDIKALASVALQSMLASALVGTVPVNKA